MRIAILGAGFTGLSAALRLLEKGHQVTILEKEDSVGGLAGGFKMPGWEWTLEKSYHHWFKSDQVVLNLAKKLHQPILTIKPQTNIYIKGQILPIDSPLALLTFPYLPLLDSLRTGFWIFYLRYLYQVNSLEGTTALSWIRDRMGPTSARLIWEPLFDGKFGDFKEKISLPWFWGRIKKRSKTLCYPEGGIAAFAGKIAEKIENLGGKILLNSEVLSINSNQNTINIILKTTTHQFDKIIVTLPTPTFIKITLQLPKAYVKKISSIPHLTAQNLILILKKPFLQGTYWLNINEPGFPFLLLAEHTNFIKPQHYGGQHILYIGNYLPNKHPYLQMSAKQLLNIYNPFLKQINSQFSILNYQLFTQPFAQPVVDVNYLQKIPQFKTPLKNIYLANMDMIYPWDRETNYAVELGEKVAELIASG